MPQLDSFKDITSPPIDFKALEIETKVFVGSTKMVLCHSSQKHSKDTKDLCAVNSDM